MDELRFSHLNYLLGNTPDHIACNGVGPTVLGACAELPAAAGFEWDEAKKEWDGAKMVLGSKIERNSLVDFDPNACNGHYTRLRFVSDAGIVQGDLPQTQIPGSNAVCKLRFGRLKNGMDLRIIDIYTENERIEAVRLLQTGARLVLDHYGVLL